MTSLPDSRASRGSSLLTGPDLPPLDVTDLGAALRAAAAAAPERCYIGFLDAKNVPTEVTFGGLLAGAEHLARALVASQVKPGDRVLLLLPTGPGFLDAFFGTILAGAIPVPWPVPLTLGGIDPYVEGTVARIAKDAGVTFALTTERAAGALGRVMASLGAAEQVRTLDALRASAPDAGELPLIDTDAVALLQYTSGRTHLPGGVRLTHRQLLSNVAGVSAALRLGEDDIAVSWIPLVHDMGLVGVLFAGLWGRFTSYVMAPEAFLMRPYRWLQAISTFRATLSAAPNFAYRLCVRRIKDRHLEGVDLSCWRLALNGAEQVQPATCDAFVERFEAAGFARGAFYPLYGLAENALAATCPPLSRTYETRALDASIVRSPRVAASPAPAKGDAVASVGQPLPGQRVAVIDAEGAILPEQHEGEIVVGGVCLMEGIHGRPERTDALKRDGWLRTGDLGFVDDGRLFVTGRLKAMCIKMGRNYYPDDAEQVLEGAERDADLLGGRRATALSVGNASSGTEDLFLFLEGPLPEGDEKKALVSGVNAKLLEVLGIRADTILLRPAGTLGDDAASASLRRAHARTLLAREALEGAA